MDFRSKLSRPVGIGDIREITHLVQGDDRRKQELYGLLFDDNEKVARRAAWSLCHLHECEWLYNKQNELIDEALACKDPGKRRVLLTILYRQPFPESPRTDFLDFCLERMVSKHEPPAVQSLCVKLAYEQCLHYPELLQELRTILEIMEPELLPPSIRCVRKNILTAIRTGKRFRTA